MTDQLKPPLPVRSWRYLQRHGIRRLARRVVDEFRAPPGASPLAEHPNLPSAGIAEVGADEIHASVDTPQDGAIETSSVMLLSGWTCALDGIARIRTFVDGVSSGTVTHGYARPDVANYLPRIPTAGSSGFLAEVDVSDLLHGAHRLEIAVEDSGGHTRVISVLFHTVADEALYRAFLVANEPSAAENVALRRQLRASGVQVILWVDASGSEDERGLSATLESVVGQTYRNWQCRVLTSEKGHSAVADVVARLGLDLNDQFEIVDTKGFAEATNVSGAYSGILAAGETLEQHAFLRLAGRVAGLKPRPLVIYSDHDTIDEGGIHSMPWLNPDWSPDYLLARDYVGGFYLFDDQLRLAVATDLQQGPAWRYDLLLRLTDGGVSVVHEPHVLWSAAEITDEDAAAKAQAELAVVRSCLARRNSGASVEESSVPGMRRIHWPVTVEPRVSIIVPTTGKLAYVEPLLASMKMTSYANYELVVIDNSRGRNPEGIALLRAHGARIIERDEDFNWAKLNNDGVREARGELLLFLNDDIEIVDPAWLSELVSQAIRPEIGAVGGLLLYPDGRIQHGGVFFVGYGGGAVHLFLGMDPNEDIYLDLHRVQREVSAVTGACLMVRRSVFDEAGGFDERLAIAGNDVDLCLRLMTRGLRNIWTPYCRLVHHESASRRDASIVSDETTMWQIWGDFLRAGDPFHSPHFAKNRVDCALDASRISFVADEDRHPHGVNLVGYARAEMGLGQATRGTAAALEAARIPFSIIDYQYGNPSRMNDNSWAAWETDHAIYDVNVVYVNADLVPEAYPRLPNDVFDGRYTIGAWTWELPDFPDEWMPSFALVDEVWVPSTFVQQAVAMKSPVPVVRMPHAVEAPAGPFMSRAELGLPADPYLFLMMYDVFSVRQRKNPEGAIEAFCGAFAPDDQSVGLVIKLNNADRSRAQPDQDADRRTAEYPSRGPHAVATRGRFPARGDGLLCFAPSLRRLRPRDR